MATQRPHTDIGISHQEFIKLPKVVRTWINRTFHQLNQTATEADAKAAGRPRRAADAMFSAPDVAQVDRIDAILNSCITAILHACDEGTEAVEDRLHDLAQLCLARAVFKSLRDGTLPAAYAHRAVWGLVDAQRRAKTGAAAVTNDDPAPWTFGE